MDWILSTIVLLGNFMIGRKWKWGWIVIAVNSLLWVYYALWFLTPPQYGLVPSAIVNFFIAVFSARKWFKDDQ